MIALNYIDEDQFQAPFSINDDNHSYDFFFLVTIEKEIYLIPSRTQKSSPSSPMVLRTRVWKSRTLPGFYSQSSRLCLELFFYAYYLYSLLHIRVLKEHQNVCKPFSNKCAFQLLPQWVCRG